MNARTLPCPELADPALSRIQAAVDGALEDARKCNAWFVERDQYIRYALKGDPDWAKWDMDASAQLLLEIQRAMNELPPEAFKATCQRLIAQRIQDAARGHADTCDRNGRLYDMEHNVGSLG
jgi:hypothetical protein